jgi:hypothetical protein
MVHTNLNAQGQRLRSSHLTPVLRRVTSRPRPALLGQALANRFAGCEGSAIVAVVGNEHDQLGHAAAIKEAALTFIGSVLPVLAGEHLYPRPPSNPFIHIGLDYFGSRPDLPNFELLKDAIEASHPRFAEATPLHDRDSSAGYVYSFLEACVARLAPSIDPWDVGSEAVQQSVEELIKCATNEESEVSCCRVVSHVTTVDGETHRLGDIEVVPIVADSSDHHEEVLQTVRAVIPGAGFLFRDRLDTQWRPPESVLIARSSTSKPFDGLSELSKTLTDLLLTAHLLTGATAQSAYEVWGNTSVVGKSRPTMKRFAGEVDIFSQTRMVRRDLVLSADLQAPIEALRCLMAQAYTETPNMVVEPFGLALHRFGTSHYARSPYDQVIDLVTALEGAMGGSNTDVLLRLRTRCACLLATANDPANAIFDDIKELYDLRSRLVHGGELAAKKLDQKMTGLSGMPDDLRWSGRLVHGVDRLRDLVRRSILVRICLGSGEDPVWPIGTDVGVDRALTDDATRERWRNTWREKLDAIGAPKAWERPSRT